VGLGINPKSEKDFSLVVTLHRVKKICNGFDLHPKEDCQISEFGNPREVFLRRGRRHGSRTSITIIVFDFLSLYLLHI
jgi:hypothetical protein